MTGTGHLSCSGTGSGAWIGYAQPPVRLYRPCHPHPHDPGGIAAFGGAQLDIGADRAVRRAVRLAKAHGARLTALHVLDDDMPDDILRHLQPKTSEHLERFVGSAAGDLAFTALSCVGDPTETLLAMIQDQDPALVVLGTHRRRAILDSMRETTVQRIVRLTDYPVLVVGDTVDHPYEHILAATDFSRAAGKALNLGHALAPMAEITPINALHVPYRGMFDGDTGKTPARAAARPAAGGSSPGREEGAFPATTGGAPLYHARYSRCS